MKINKDEVWGGAKGMFGVQGDTAKSQSLRINFYDKKQFQ